VHPLLIKDVEVWTAEDLEALVAAKLPEGLRIDYKRELALDSRKQRAEVCKDVSGFANAQGGWLFYGIDEDDSDEPLPIAVKPFKVGGLLTVLEDILDSSLQPRAHFHAAAIRTDGGSVIVVHIEPRQGEPIMVQGYGEHRYYRRSGTRTAPMAGDEVGAAHIAARDRVSEVYDLLAHPHPTLSRISRMRARDELDFAIHAPHPGWKPKWLPLPIVVVAAMDCTRPLIHHSVFADREAFPEPRAGMLGGDREVLPQTGWRLNAHGLTRQVINEDGPRPWYVLHLAAVYRLGIVEWARRYPNMGDYVIPAHTFAQDVHDALLYAASVFSSVDYFGRLATFVRIENAEQATLELPTGIEAPVQHPEVEWLGNFREVSTDELLVDPTPVVREAMDVLSQGFGVRRSPYFDPDTGAWLI
jgi:hypothetical protein